MKISEFAEKTNVTVKMLRYYDEIGLLHPDSTDAFTGYRIYIEDQQKLLNWINILKHLGFSLKEIKRLLYTPVDSEKLIGLLKDKHSQIKSEMNVQISKQVQITKLIKIIEKEGFDMNKKVDLMKMSHDDVIEVMKNMPNMGHLLEAAGQMLINPRAEKISIIRMDLSHFKSVNDDYGYEIGDIVIAKAWKIFNEVVKNEIHDAQVARSHGDEFIAIAFADEAIAEKMAVKTIHDLNAYDFSGIGYPKKIGCKIGIVVKQSKNVDIRSAMHETIAALYEAAKKGVNAYHIQN